MSGVGGSGVQGGRAIENPDYSALTYEKIFTGGNLTSLNNGTEMPFQRITGHQRLIMKFGTLSTDPVCSFNITGGSNTSQSSVSPMFPTSKSYTSSIDYVPAESARGCTVFVEPQPVGTTRTNIFSVTVPPNLYFTEGQVFHFAFAPAVSVQPVITHPATTSFTAYVSNATGTYAVAGNILTVVSINEGKLFAGDVISATGLTPGTAIVAQLTGVTGGIGTYTVNGAAQLVGGSTAGSIFTKPQLALTAGGMGTMSLKLVYYRAVPNMRAGGIPTSFGAPMYFEMDYTTLFNGGPNPIDDLLKHNFKRYNGIQDIIVTNLTTGFYFAFSLDYGINGQAGGYLGLAAPNANPKLTATAPENCTITPLTGGKVLLEPSSYLVSSPGDGRSYTFVFNPYPYNQIAPTIQLVGGAAFGADNVEVKVATRIFRTI